MYTSYILNVIKKSSVFFDSLNLFEKYYINNFNTGEKWKNHYEDWTSRYVSLEKIKRKISQSINQIKQNV